MSSLKSFGNTRKYRETGGKRKTRKAQNKAFRVFSSFDFAGLNLSGKNISAGTKNFADYSPLLSRGFSRNASYKSTTCGTNAGSAVKICWMDTVWRV